MKYADRVWIVCLGWLLVPLALIHMSVILPCLWVLKHGYLNSPFWHNVKAGWIIVRNEVVDAWEIRE